MKRFIFAINEVQTHQMREVGNHVATKERITVDAVNEEVARSIARTELGKRTPGGGVQKFHPGFLLESRDLDQNPKAESA